MEIYLDSSATTHIDARVMKAMKPYLEDKYGNPSSFHNKGKEARDAVEKARKQIARVLNCNENEIIFTSGGTEANNLAILGLINKIVEVRPQQQKQSWLPHIITTKIEHPSIMEACKYLERSGVAKVGYIGVDKNGVVDLKQLEKELKPETVLVSVIYANNEIGTIQDIKKISHIIQRFNVGFPKPHIKLHIDACQASEYLTLDVQRLGVDLMTINSSKVYGPKGVGALYARGGIKIKPLMYGGHQENGLRPGTENVAGIVGFAEALTLAQNQKSKIKNQNLRKLRDYFIKELFKRVSKIRLNGHPAKRLINNVNVSILDVEGEALLLHLNEKGIYASTGSACASESLDPSYVIMAIGVSQEVAQGSLRFTFGRKTTKKDIDYVLKVLPEIVKKLRKISPINVSIK